jgi:hypothetical protein
LAFCVAGCLHGGVAGDRGGTNGVADAVGAWDRHIFVGECFAGGTYREGKLYYLFVKEGAKPQAAPVADQGQPQPQQQEEEVVPASSTEQAVP